MTRRAKTPRKPTVKKGSQTNLKDPVGVRYPCEFMCVCLRNLSLQSFLSYVYAWKGKKKTCGSIIKEHLVKWMYYIV